MVAKVVRFYGLSDKEIKAMKYIDLEKYWKAIDVLEAQEMLLEMNLADWPHAKKDQRDKIHRYWHKRAFPNTYSQNHLTSDKFATMFGGMINGRR